ncbi:MAG: MBL fold metallo-hydrolase [Deltaproteobacteria bacterium]|nr:MBL fold metallo-hydrolase [Deltaproteobacteria bacterium]MBW2660644.1 MBL fold metallo-hydrolase [Deltaproteobacteria bacterium]
MKITIIYDNEAFDERLAGDWGFSCLIEVFNRKILFDTGANGDILLENMNKLNIDPLIVDEIFISHDHWDHIGGLSAFLKINKARVYIPYSCPEPVGAREVIKIKEPLMLHENIFSTGELKNAEQSIIIKHNEDVVVVAGCSHPGVGEILEAASKHGKVGTLIGGLHGFKEFDLIDNLKKICPTHCTKFIHKISELYPDKYIEGGAGKVITI